LVVSFVRLLFLGAAVLIAAMVVAVVIALVAVDSGDDGKS